MENHLKDRTYWHSERFQTQISLFFTLKWNIDLKKLSETVDLVKEEGYGYTVKSQVNKEIQKAI
jgi:hypothetical protein